MPALVGGAAFAQRSSSFAFRSTRGAILFGENDVRRLADGFLLSVAEDSFGPRIPARNSPVEIHGKNRVFARVFHDEPHALLTLAQRLLSVLCVR